ncbi:oligosaccharide flippase family protein [Mesoterricola sediminis]|uniref:Polysaccharide biosynthesis protein n=1 Tax=Mesoterricola sediminis TaxID=2927980 RepID=A0AA48KD30_9BACT|nr:oligosaccharide flippase family protein [Mesoterricola sediminis]BDU75922.1 polysaccharide biosynthesis protein [Mesoterricola sediminis]
MTPRRPGFMRSLASLAGGAAAGQIVAVLASPVVTRLYTPAEIGAFSVFSTLAMLLNSTNSLRYEMAIPMAEDEDRARHLVWLCFLLVGGFSVLLAGASWAWGPAFCGLVKVPDLVPHLWMLPLTVAAAGAYEALNFQAIRRQGFGALAQARVAQGLGMSGVQVGAGFLGAGTVGLVAGDLAGRVLSVLRLLRRDLFQGPFPWQGVRKAAKDFDRYPKYMAGASILNLAAIQVPFLLIPLYFGADMAGHYFLAYRTLFLPASFVGTAISQVFLGEAAERAREGEDLGRLTSRIFLLLAAVYLPVYIICTAGAGVLFPAVFGPRWSEAGRFAQILAPMTLLWSLARPICGMLLVRDRLKESLAFTVFELAATVGAIWAGHLSGSVERTALYVSGAGLAVSITSIGRFLHAAGVQWGPVLRVFGTLTAFSVPLGLLVAVAARTGSSLVTLGAALAGFAAVGLATFRFLRREGLL